MNFTVAAPYLPAPRLHMKAGRFFIKASLTCLSRGWDRAAHVQQRQDLQQWTHSYHFSHLKLFSETELPPHDKLFFLTDINKKKKKLFSYFAPSANPTPHCTTFLMRLQPHKHIKRPQPGTSIMCFSPHVFVPLSAGGAMGETRNRVDLSVWTHTHTQAQVVQRRLCSSLCLGSGVGGCRTSGSMRKLNQHRRQLPGHYHLNIICALNNIFMILLPLSDHWCTDGI